ncbi:MAG: ABC transporter ATP-binding protein [Flavobacteriales bacterium]|nr:ABC transporter ATP-binding protein [Flavobacteriales bacterium]
MEIQLNTLTKHYGREVVIGGVSHTFAPGSRTALLGPNGSGKSTLLQLVAGALAPTSGTVQHRLGGVPLPEDEVYRHVSIAAPYLGLYEDLSLRQTVEMHARFKPLRAGMDAVRLAQKAYLHDALDKQVLHFSSGMKQRLKLALAILSDTPLLLLDEPASNLDTRAIEWWQGLLEEHLERRTLLVASNDPAVETVPCTERIDLRELRAL